MDNTVLLIWSIINMIFASRIAYMLILNPAMRIASRISISYLNELVFFVIILIYVIHFSGMFLTKIFISNEIMILLSAFLFFNWTVIAYYLLQKYTPPTRKVVIIIKSPNFLILRIVLSILSLSVSLIIITEWYFVFIIVVTWYLYGFICTEVAIQKEMRFLKCDRNHAVTALNNYQGRTWPNTYKYPFP